MTSFFRSVIEGYEELLMLSYLFTGVQYPCNAHLYIICCHFITKKDVDVENKTISESTINVFCLFTRPLIETMVPLMSKMH